MFETVIRKSSAALVLLLFVFVVASSVYVFDPSSSWNELIASSHVPAPEFQPAMGVDEIYDFFSAFNDENRSVYFYYEGFVDVLFFVSIFAFSMGLLGLALQRNPSLASRFQWALYIPVALFFFEVLEGSSLLLVMSLVPDRFELLLWVSDVATAGKMATYAMVALLNILGVPILIYGFVRDRK